MVTSGNQWEHVVTLYLEPKSLSPFTHVPCAFLPILCTRTLSTIEKEMLVKRTIMPELKTFLNGSHSLYQQDQIILKDQ